MNTLRHPDHHPDHNAPVDLGRNGNEEATMKDRTSTRRQRNARRRVLCQVMKRSRATTLWMVKHRKVLLTLLRHGLNWWLTHHGYEPLSLDTALWRALKGENEL